VRWPWRRNQPSEVTDLPKADPKAAEKAKRDAQAQREQVEKDNAYIDWLHKQLATHGAENHFSEMIVESMRRKRT
jgi:hypothetical protein